MSYTIKINRYLKLEKHVKFFLNTVMGLISFNFGLACLGTKHPSRYACISIIFIFLLECTFCKNNAFSQKIERIRKKENKTKKEEEFIKHMDKNAKNVKYWIKKLPVFLLGFIFLGLVALGIIN